MRIFALNRFCLVLAIALVAFGSKTQAGGQCSKGGICSSGTVDPKAQAEMERQKSKMESQTARRAVISSANQKREITGADMEKTDKIYDEHKKVVEKWVTAHHPELKKDSPAFRLKVHHAMSEDQDSQ